MNAQSGQLPRLAIIMPSLNEEKHILKSITSVLEFDYPRDRVTLTVVDGMSTDRTRQIVDSIAARDPRVTMLDNPARLHGPALNKAIDSVDCDVVLRVDAHSTYPKDYAILSVTALLETGASNVGGLFETVPGAETAVAHAIAFALSHPFGVGNASYRTGTLERKWTDTVPFGCWRISTLRDLGGFAIDIPYGEDDELNGRLIAQGGKILLEPRIRAKYVARSSLFAFLLMLFRYGRSKPLTWRSLGRVPTLRQLAPLVLSLAVLIPVLMSPLMPLVLVVPAVTIALHFTIGVAVAINASGRTGLHTAALLPFVFLLGHLAYGTGVISGVLKVLYESVTKTESTRS